MIPDNEMRLLHRARRRCSLGLGLRLGLSGGGLFNPMILFANNEQGVWFDPSDLSTIFQDSAGTTAGAVGSPVGLHLDKSKGLALGAELLGSGATGLVGTATAASYNTSTGAGSVTNVDASNYSYVRWTQSAGPWYKVTVTNTGSVSLWVQSGLSLVTVAAGATSTSYHTGVTITIRAAAAGTATFTVTSFKHIAGNPRYQTTAASRPALRQSGGYYINGDGSDDNLLGTALAGASNSVAVKVTVPASISATQVLLGLQASASTALFIALNTSGNICGGVGSDGVTTIKGSTDLRGTTGVAILVANGTTVTLYWNGVSVYSGAQNGNPSTSVPFRYFALNNNGTAANFCPADIHRSLSIQRELTTTEIAQLTTHWS